MREFGECRSCGEEIEWAWLNGKPHPFDANPTTDGTYELTERAGDKKALALHVGKGGAARVVKSHFATCPHADEWRSGNPKPKARHRDYASEVEIK